MWQVRVRAAEAITNAAEAGILGHAKLAEHYKAILACLLEGMGVCN